MASTGILTVLILFAMLSASHGARIVFLLPVASRSHVHVFEPLMKALGERGHEVVVLSPLVSSGMPPTVTQIQTITVDDVFGTMPDPFEERKQGLLAAMFNSSASDHMNVACEKALKSKKFQDLLKSENFDLVIIDIFMNWCVAGTIPHFKAPSILVSTVAAPGFLSAMVGNRLSSSFVPCVFLSYSDKMTFFERVINTVLDQLTAVFFDKFFVLPGEQMYKKHLPNGNELPGINEILLNTSMIFMNSHFTLTYPRPLLPDVIEVGGMHTRSPKKLPKDLDEFLTGSGKDGFIFFSLGSIVKAKDMPESYRKVFLNVFSRLKQRVIWKWETETMPDLPKNVKLSKWLPQQDILGHPNIKLFMTHGGLLSTQESVYHGVPVLGLPLFGDQDLNVKQAEKGGYAKFVEIVDITEERLEKALLELLNNPIYKKKAKELSKLVQDLPETPLDKAVYWTEYVLRHNGAPHLRSAARDLTFFQYYVLDVAAALIAIVLIILYLSFLCCRSVKRCVCGSNTRKPIRVKKD